MTKRGHDDAARVHSVGAFCPNTSLYKAAVMQDKAEIDERVSDAELIALASEAQAEIETRGEVSERNLLLCDFAWELLKKRLWMMECFDPGQFEQNRRNQLGKWVLDPAKEVRT
jgi:hypothetical protein